MQRCYGYGILQYHYWKPVDSYVDRKMRAFAFLNPRATFLEPISIFPPRHPTMYSQQTFWQQDSRSGPEEEKKEGQRGKTSRGI